MQLNQELLRLYSVFVKSAYTLSNSGKIVENLKEITVISIFSHAL